jgi:hypothetical protein
METTDWEHTQELSSSWTNGESAIANPDPPAPPQNEEMTLERARESFLARAKARDLKKQTFDKYELLSRKRKAFAVRKGRSRLRDFNLDVLEEWQAEWEESALTRMK